MKRVFIIIKLYFFVCAVFSQTILWKQSTSPSEGYCGGEAVSLNNEIYFESALSDSSQTAFFYKFNPKKNQWIKLADIPEPKANLALLAIKGKAYAIGGDLFKKTNREYDPQSNNWNLMEPIPMVRQHIGAGVVGNNIYVNGDLISWKDITKKNETYNVLSNSWSETENNPSLRNNPGVISLDSLIYVIGGA